MSKMIERVAVALNGVPVIAGPEYARRLARAAIEAMREPTAAMNEAGYFDANHSIESVGDLAPPPEEQPKLIWQAMIDAALK